ncbi:MAG: hypothetical protein K9H16_01580 [Bacteroidales bacterium]|nr:hypothetical protein [Bacteroidales bacterium]
MKHFYNPLPGFKLKFKTIVLLFFGASFFYSSCNKFKDDFDFNKMVKPSWNPEFAVPLVNSTLYIADFMKDSSNLNIVSNPDQSLSFIYSGDSILSATAGTFAKLPDQEFNFPQTFNLPPLLPGFFDTINFIENYQFIADTINQRIDSIFLNDGLLYISGQTNLNRDNASLKLTIPDIKNIETGKALEIISVLDNPGGQSSVIYFDTTYQLDDYKIVLNQLGDTLRNSITFILDIIIEGDENPDLSPYEFVVGGSMTSLEFGSAYGYFGKYSLAFADSLEIGLFNDAITGGVAIGEGSVKLTFDIHNSIGTPVTFTAQTLAATSEFTPPYLVDIELFGAGVPNEFSINSPDINHIGENVNTKLDFTQANFAEAFNISPNWLHYNLQGITNFGQDSTVQNFLLNESRISLDVDLEFQLFGSLADLTIQDTVALDFNNNPDEIDYALFRINLTNGFPISASVQAYFADQNFQILDSLMSEDNTVLLGAPTNGAPEYRVTEPKNKVTDILVEKTKLEHIVNSKFLLFKTKLSTSQQELIKIYDDYAMTVKLGAVVGLSIENKN